MKKNFGLLRTLVLLLAVFLLALQSGCAPASMEPADSTPAANASATDADVTPEDVAAAAPAVTPTPLPTATPVPAPTPVKFPAKGYCNGEGVNLRAEPSTTAEIVDIMGQNAVLDVMNLQDGWYKLNMGGVTAYVSEDLITLGDPPRPDNMRWAKVTSNEAQLYKSLSPGDVSEIKLKQGDVVKVLRAIDDLLHVVYNGNLQRYIKAADVTYISAEEAMTALEAAKDAAGADGADTQAQGNFPVPSPTAGA